MEGPTTTCELGWSPRRIFIGNVCPQINSAGQYAGDDYIFVPVDTYHNPECDYLSTLPQP